MSDKSVGDELMGRLKRFADSFRPKYHWGIVSRVGSGVWYPKKFRIINGDPVWDMEFELCYLTDLNTEESAIELAILFNDNDDKERHRQK